MEKDMQNKRRALRLVIFWALAIGWIAVLFFFSGQTAAESSALSGSLADLVRGIFPFNRIPPDQLEHVLRKLAHFGFFGLEGLLLGLAAMQSVRRLRAGAASVQAVARRQEEMMLTPSPISIRLPGQRSRPTGPWARTPRPRRTPSNEALQRRRSVPSTTPQKRICCNDR